MNDPLKPSVTTLVKIGSLLVHYQEARDTGHAFDAIACRQLENDPEVKEWLKSMTDLALLPVKR